MWSSATNCYAVRQRGLLACQIALLTKSDRKILAALGIRLGASSLFFPKLQQPRLLSLRARLWAVRQVLN